MYSLLVIEARNLSETKLPTGIEIEFVCGGDSPIICAVAIASWLSTMVVVVGGVDWDAVRDSVAWGVVGCIPARCRDCCTEFSTFASIDAVSRSFHSVDGWKDEAVNCCLPWSGCGRRCRWPSH
jgi:hypothetical protein